MNRMDQQVLVVGLVIGLGMLGGRAAHAEDATTATADPVSEINLDGALTPSQAETIAQHPNVDKYLEGHPRLAQEIAQHPNAARFLENHPRAAVYLANHPEARARLHHAAERWRNATPEQRAEWAAAKGERLERRGEHRENRGERMQNQGQRMEHRGQRIERRGESMHQAHPRGTAVRGRR